MKIEYAHNLVPLARAMRKHGTHGEALLWNILKQRQMRGYQFLRQRPVGSYITDFMCQRLKLIVEIDGASHGEKSDQDAERTAFLEQQGFTVVRFSEHAVCTRRESVIEAIQEWITEHAPAGYTANVAAGRSTAHAQTADGLPLEKGEAKRDLLG